MSIWSINRINDFAEIVAGGTPSTSVDEYWNGNIGWITPADLSNYKCRYISKGERNITELGLRKSSACLLPKNTVLLSSRAPIGYVAIAESELATNQGFKNLICNEEKVDYRFIYYWLSLNTEVLKSFASGATFPEISASKVKKIKAIIPDVPTQKRIADILSTYDDLIENNNHRITLLEKAAQELYKEWFVRFCFPGHETNELVNSRLGKIPSSFNVIKMKEAFDYHVGGGWGNDECSTEFSEKAYVIRGTDFPRVQKGDLSSCPLRYHKKSNYIARELKENDIVIEVSGGTAEQPVGRTIIVTNDVVERLGGKVICASFCKLIRLNPEIISPYFFYYWMQFLYDTRIIDRFQLQSTGIINFKFEYFLRKGDIMLPPKSLMKEFEIKVKSFYDEISLLARQNENLIKQRDLLLPRLMSGKLEV